MPDLRHSVARAFAALIVAIALTSSLASAADERPNIIVIMCDDMGYSDIGCYGGEIHTPTLDGLAENGVRFTQFYNTGRCCPTRACLLTGLYPHQAGIGHMMEDHELEGYRGDLNKSCVTMAQVLKPAGYGTYMVGKWHVTPLRPSREAPSKHNWPLQRGFDHFYGTIHGAGSFYDPNSLTRDNEYISPDNDPEYQPDVFYYTDALSEHAARFIREHDKQKDDEPLFMYVAYTAAHWPMHALPEDIAKYEGRYDKGWDVLREERYQRMIDMGLIDPKWALSPRDEKSPAWEDAKDKEWECALMEVYAAMIDRMDQGVGRIVDALKETDEFDNTVILWFQDNGGCAEGMGRGGQFTPRPTDPSALKPMADDALQYDMIPKVTRDGYPVRQGRGVMPGPADTYLGYGLSWANASNTPFRMYKHFVHEGGVSTPLIISWPNGVDPSLKGKFYDEPAHLIDVMATCVDLGEAEYPTEIDGEKITPMEGVSLAPSLSGDSLGRETPIFFEHEANRAIRDGEWKLVAKGRLGAWELYNMTADRSELIDLAAEKPEMVDRMAKQWEDWAVRAHAKPWFWGQNKEKK